MARRCSAAPVMHFYSGRPMHLLSGVDTPGERITRERVIGYLQSLEGCGNATQTIMARLQELYEAALVMDPRQDWQWIRNIAAIVRGRHIPARDKRSRIVGDEQLVDLGFSLIEGAEGRNLRAASVSGSTRETGKCVDRP